MRLSSVGLGRQTVQRADGGEHKISSAQRVATPISGRLNRRSSPGELVELEGVSR